MHIREGKAKSVSVSLSLAVGLLSQTPVIRHGETLAVSYAYMGVRGG